MFDRLVRMQHFNLPTRLLDVSANPLVALYFATEIADARLEPAADGKVSYISVPRGRMKYFDSDTVSCISNLSKMSAHEKELIHTNLGMPTAKFNKLPAVDRLLQFIREEKPHFRPEINADELDRLWFVLPKFSNRRIIAQNGAFLIFGLSKDQPASPGPHPIRFRDIIIPKAAKSSIRQDLDTLGIKESALFPEIDRAAGYIVKRYP
jgi:hypothetical protein